MGRWVPGGRGRRPRQSRDERLYACSDRQPYRDTDIDCRQLVVDRHSPRWLRDLTRYGWLPADDVLSVQQLWRTRKRASQMLKLQGRHGVCSRP